MLTYLGDYTNLPIDPPVWHPRLGDPDSANGNSHQEDPTIADHAVTILSKVTPETFQPTFSIWIGPRSTKFKKVVKTAAWTSASREIDVLRPWVPRLIRLSNVQANRVYEDWISEREGTRSLAHAIPVLHQGKFNWVLVLCPQQHWRWARCDQG